MGTIAMVLMMAVIVEAIVEVVKGWVPAETKTPGWVWPVVSAVLGVGLCIAASVDVFALLDVSLSVPLLGAVLTGVLISRGANFVHDLWNNIKNSTTEINTTINMADADAEDGANG
ncbi:hypothetical protein LJC74_03695 [Eubacteriales bacterium OttesenSCG-928-A19]|nr:hypothetical protein [Eubacteriales bacterium OttesenSCG-928-A19]